MPDILDPNSDEVTIQRVHKGSSVDYKQVKETLSTTVIDTETGEPISDEIEAILDRIRGTHDGDPRYVYYIALVGDAIRGVMGMARLMAKMIQCANMRGVSMRWR